MSRAPYAPLWLPVQAQRIAGEQLSDDQQSKLATAIHWASDSAWASRTRSSEGASRAPTSPRGSGSGPF